ncbi:hypothetical protein SEA_CASSITA_73 [Microbacterium phage Cassita]|nr:hypothetical protein SEA_CASSITA_73 [Microbacterium phage Cassita]
MAEPYVALYVEGHWLTDVGFKYKWQAWLFHAILNKSIDAAGVRHY